MKASRNNIPWLIALSILLASCSPSQAWIPPSAPPGALVALDYIVPVPLPTPAAPLEKTVISQIESSVPQPTLSVTPAQNEPDVTPSPFTPPESAPILYYAQAADTLPVVAIRFGVQADEISSAEPIPDQGFINPGQLLVIPNRLGETTQCMEILRSERLMEAERTNAEVLVSSCVFCKNNLNQAALEDKSALLVTDISEILKDCEFYES